jgi:hypothetical protein
MMSLRKLGLAILFGVGYVGAWIFVAPVIYFISKRRHARAFHPQGTMCRAEVASTELDLAGPALVRISGASGDEDSATHTVVGMAIKFSGGQDLPLASFESFLHVASATANTDITDYLANTFASVSPWKIPDTGIVWFRAHRVLPAGTTGSKEPTRTGRLRDDIANQRATIDLEIHSRPKADGPLLRKLATITLTEIIPEDPTFRISMFHTGRGIVPTGFRNGVRAAVYPVSQRARG